jgi:hypothetical protein
MSRQRAQHRRRRKSQRLSCGYRKVRAVERKSIRPDVDGRPTDRECADLSELALGATMKTTFPNPDDILNFTLTIEPDEGMYKGGSFVFTFAMNNNCESDTVKASGPAALGETSEDLPDRVPEALAQPW